MENMLKNSKQEEEVIVITIDGPSASGKGTIGQMLAEKMGFAFLDSGAIYRVLAYVVLHKGVDIDDEDAVSALAETLEIEFKPRLPLSPRVIYEEKDISEDIRGEECASVASQIAVKPKVRAALLECQRNFAKMPGLVADGRDMGTVVFPDAPVKFYLTASVEERAERRVKQLQERGKNASLHKILEDLRARDARDSGRKTAPLKPAQDAVLIDTTKLSIDEVLQKVMECL